MDWRARLAAYLAERLPPASSVESVKPQPLPPVAPVSWETTRPDQSAPCRLDNALSPMWLPIREPVVGNEPVVAFAWFGRAA